MLSKMPQTFLDLVKTAIYFFTRTEFISEQVANSLSANKLCLGLMKVDQKKSLSKNSSKIRTDRFSWKRGNFAKTKERTIQENTTGVA